MCKSLCCLATVILVSAVSSTASGDFVAYYKLDDGLGTTVTDDGTLGNHGTLVGGGTWVAGAPGGASPAGALSFDGVDDVVNLGNPPGLNFGTGDWTTGGWFKTTAQPDETGGADRGTRSVYGQGGDWEGGQRITIQLHEAGANTMVLTTDDDATKRQAGSSLIANDGNWHHVAAVREGTDLRLYLDGLLEGTNTAPDGYDLSGIDQWNAYIGALTHHPTGKVFRYWRGRSTTFVYIVIPRLRSRFRDGWSRSRQRFCCSL